MVSYGVIWPYIIYLFPNGELFMKKSLITILIASNCGFTMVDVDPAHNSDIPDGVRLYSAGSVDTSGCAIGTDLTKHLADPFQQLLVSGSSADGNASCSVTPRRIFEAGGVSPTSSCRPSVGLSNNSDDESDLQAAELRAQGTEFGLDPNGGEISLKELKECTTLTAEGEKVKKASELRDKRIDLGLDPDGGEITLSELSDRKVEIGAGIHISAMIDAWIKMIENPAFDLSSLSSELILFLTGQPDRMPLSSVDHNRVDSLSRISHSKLARAYAEVITKGGSIPDELRGFFTESIAYSIQAALVNGHFDYKILPSIVRDSIEKQLIIAGFENAAQKGIITLQSLPPEIRENLKRLGGHIYYEDEGWGRQLSETNFGLLGHYCQEGQAVVREEKRLRGEQVKPKPIVHGRDRGWGGL